MIKIISISIILYFSLAVNAQSINVDKSTVSNTESSIVEITSVAIPLDQICNSEIDPENYHKSVSLEDSANFVGHNVEISMSVTKYYERDLNTEKKEIFKPDNSRLQNNSTNVQKALKVKFAAVRHQ